MSPNFDPQNQQPAGMVDDKDVLDWVELRGLENIKEHSTAIDALKADSSAMLAILVTADGASIAYIVKSVDKHVFTGMTLGACILCGYLFILGAILIAKCLRGKPTPTMSNQPKNLLQPNFTLIELKRAELATMENRIQEIRQRNSSTGVWLNRVRYAALFSPLVFVVGFLLHLAFS